MWCDKYQINYCPTCKSDQSLYENNGLCSQCYSIFCGMSLDEQRKEKRRIRDRINYILNTEKIKERNRNGHEKHKEERNTIRRHKRQENLEVFRQKDRERYQRDRENRCAQASKFRIENPEKIAFWNKRWRERNNKKKQLQLLNSYSFNHSPALQQLGKIIKTTVSIKYAKRRIYYLKNRVWLLEHQKQYYAQNSKIIIEKAKLYAAANREQRLSYYRDYYIKNRDMVLQKKRIREKNDPEKYKLIGIKHHIKNRDYYIAYSRQYYQVNRIEILENIRLNNYDDIQLKLDPLENEKRTLHNIERQVQKAPTPFKKILSTYRDDLIKRRNRKIERGSISSAKLTSLYQHIILICNFLTWLFENGFTFLSMLDAKNIQIFFDNRKIKNIGTLKKFFNYCRQERYILHNPITHVQTQRQCIRKFGATLPEDQQFKLYDIMTNSETEPILALVIMLLLLHGLTHQQIRTLRLTDIDFENGKITVPNLSGFSEYQIILDDEDLIILYNYIEFRNKLVGILPNPDYLIVVFYSIIRNKAIAFNTLSAVFKKVDPSLTTTVIHNTWLKNFIFSIGDVRLTAAANGYSPQYLARRVTLLGLNLEL